MTEFVSSGNPEVIKDDKKRKLAYIASIEKLSPTELPSDNIEVATIGLWQCIVKKGFNIGDKVIYISIDSVLDLTHPMFSTYDEYTKRIKTRKFRGSESQGLVIGIDNIISSFPDYDIDSLKDGDDLTDFLNITKYILPEETSQYANPDSQDEIPKIKITSIIESTDEPRIQACTNIDSIRGRPIIVTKKMDGCSCSFILYNGKFCVAGRNFIWTHDDPNAINYYVIAHELDIEKKMMAYNTDIAIRGELMGPKINKGRTGVSKLTFMVFNVYDFKTAQYLNYDDCMRVCLDLNLTYVPVLYRGNIDDINSVDKYSFFDSSQESDAEYKKSLLKNFIRIAEMQDTWYTAKLRAEGIVVKTDDDKHRISFKIISPKYLLKHDI